MQSLLGWTSAELPRAPRENVVSVPRVLFPLIFCLYKLQVVLSCKLKTTRPQCQVHLVCGSWERGPKSGSHPWGGRIQDEENPMNGSRILSTAMFREGRKLVDASTRKKAKKANFQNSNFQNLNFQTFKTLNLQTFKHSNFQTFWSGIIRLVRNGEKI